MKEIYEKPLTELTEFELADVFTTASTVNPGDDNPTPWPFG